MDHFLNKNDIRTIKLHLDNDRAGKDTTKIIDHHLHKQYEIQDCSPKKYKDINEQLVKTDVKNHQIRIQ